MLIVFVWGIVPAFAQQCGTKCQIGISVINTVGQYGTAVQNRRAQEDADRTVRHGQDNERDIAINGQNTAAAMNHDNNQTQIILAQINAGQSQGVRSGYLSAAIDANMQQQQQFAAHSGVEALQVQDSSNSNIRIRVPGDASPAGTVSHFTGLETAILVTPGMTYTLAKPTKISFVQLVGTDHGACAEPIMLAVHPEYTTMLMDGQKVTVPVLVTVVDDGQVARCQIKQSARRQPPRS